jgi:hypothetical protein
MNSKCYSKAMALSYQTVLQIDRQSQSHNNFTTFVIKTPQNRPSQDEEFSNHE